MNTQLYDCEGNPVALYTKKGNIISSAKRVSKEEYDSHKEEHGECRYVRQDCDYTWKIQLNPDKIMREKLNRQAEAFKRVVKTINQESNEIPNVGFVTADVEEGCFSTRQPIETRFDPLQHKFELAVCTKEGTVNGHTFKVGDVYPILGGNNGIHICYENTNQSPDGDPADLLCHSFDSLAPVGGKQFCNQDGTIPPLFRSIDINETISYKDSIPIPYIKDYIQALLAQAKSPSTNKADSQWYYDRHLAVTSLLDSWMDGFSPKKAVSPISYKPDLPRDKDTEVNLGESTFGESTKINLGDNIDETKLVLGDTLFFDKYIPIDYIKKKVQACESELSSSNTNLADRQFFHERRLSLLSLLSDWDWDSEHHFYHPSPNPVQNTDIPF